MNYKTLLSAMWIVVLLLGFASPAQAGGISDVSPAEGTVGTEVTLSGSGFGQKHGTVMIGAEKCKVLEWDDNEITFLIDKPQPYGEYTITVLTHGNKKPAEPMTFSPFTMRAPQIIPADTSTGLIWDGEAVTILGAFFGGKKGDVYLAYRAGEVQIERAKVLDWSMDSIRFEIPKKLERAYGTYILAVKNAVGTGYRLIKLSSDEPPMLGGSPGIGGEPINNTSSGIYFKGKYYIFSIKWACGLICGDARRIQMRTFSNGQLSAFLSIPKGETNAAVVPLVVKDTAGVEKLWVFHTGTGDQIWYNIFDGTNWAKSDGWFQIPGVETRSTWEVAPVYDPSNHRIAVYHEYQGYIHWVVSYDYGKSWFKYDSGQVLGFGTISTAPGATIYQDSTGLYRTFLAVGDSTPALNKAHQGHVYASYDGMGFTPVLDFGPVWGRPFLMDLSSESIALIYVKDDCYYSATAQYDGDPLIRKMNKATRQWQGPITPMSLSYESWYPPNAAINGLDGQFYLFWANYDPWQELRVWWMTAIANMLP